MNIRKKITQGLSVLGIASVARSLLLHNGRVVLNFHGISMCRYTNISNELQPHHSIAEFRQVLDWLTERFSFLSVDELLTTGKPGILLTFDDGHANNLVNILPLLTEYQVQGVFFISTQHVKDPQNWLSFIRRQVEISGGDKTFVPDDFACDCYNGLSEDQLFELSCSPWAVIGAHTVTHPSLPSCPPNELFRELNESKKYLEKVTGKVVDIAAYPYGDYNRTVAEATRSAGYRAAFAVDPIPVGLPAFEIPRVGIYAAAASYLDVKLSGLHRSALRGPVLT